MRSSRRNGGFTMAELLIVVGIVVILAGVSFVGVQRYQGSMTRLEFDTVAKEIFFAAQNHLTAAEGLRAVDSGGSDKLFAYQESGDVYYVINDGECDAVLDLMLPRYAIDETIRSGSYVIRYQPSTATVLDVFYSHPGQSNFLTRSGTTFDGLDSAGLTTLLTYRDGGTGDRQNYSGSVIGWYGGAEARTTGERLNAPTFEIINAEQLLVRVTDTNSGKSGVTLKLVVTGKSGGEAVLPLASGGRVSGPDSNHVYTVILDDLSGSNDLRFKNLGGITPGDDISVKVVAYSSQKLTNIAMSEEKVTNSLFADPVSILPDGSSIENNKVAIANIRHLENLDGTVSGFAAPASGCEAKQLSDLSWEDYQRQYTKAENGTTSIRYGSGTTAAATTAGCFYPVSPAYKLTYDGQNHKITDIKVSTAGDAGLFGSLTKANTDYIISNLELVDFDIASTGANAGALAGSAAGAEITNVLARNSGTGAGVTVTASGNAGGLIGLMNGGSVSHSGAALVVGERIISGSTITPTSAGGLIGKTEESAAVTGCYAGGHTKNGKYYDADSNPIYNVTASGESGAAGGLIGDAGNASITNSYSTCSVSGISAGGFVGVASGSITNCYCTGLVNTIGAEPGANDNAFIGVGTLTKSQNNYYFEIINEVVTKDNSGKVTDISYKGPGNDAVKALDENAQTYNGFLGTAAAKPYDDDTLTSYYGGKYNLKSVAELGETLKTENGKNVEFVAVHYGDWPAPEILVINN